MASRSRAHSSCSNSSGASASPSSTLAVNFTLYGAPAPRSMHRTTSCAMKAKPRRRSTKPTPPPPTTPLTSQRSTNNEMLDLSLNLSGLEGENSLTILAHGSELYLTENIDLVEKISHRNGKSVSETNEHCINTKNRSKTSFSETHEDRYSTQESEKKCQTPEEKTLGNNVINSGSNTVRSSDSAKEFVSQTCSELDSSSQGFHYVLNGNETYRSDISNSSSFVTLSEYSMDSLDGTSSSCNNSENSETQEDTSNKTKCGSNNALKVPLNTEKEDKIIKVENSSRKHLALNATKDLSKNLHYTTTVCKTRSDKNNTSTTCTQSSSGVVSNCSSDVDMQVKSVPTDDEKKHSFDLIPLPSDCKNEDHVISADKVITPTKSSVTSEVSFMKSNSICSKQDEESSFRINKNCMTDQSDGSCYSPEMFGYYIINKGHETPSEEWTVEEDTTATNDMSLCQAGCAGRCVCNRSASTYCSNFHPVNKSYSRGGSSLDEYSDEILIDIEISSQSAAYENINPPTTCSKLSSENASFSKVPYTSLEVSAIQRKSQSVLQEPRLVYSAPVHSLTPHVIRGSPTLKCECDSGRRTRQLLDRLESGYLSDMQAPDIPLTAGEIVEAVLYARQLVRVLEQALNRALSSNSDALNTDPSRLRSSRRYPSGVIWQKPRSRSLPPNALRYYKGTNTVENVLYKNHRTSYSDDVSYEEKMPIDCTKDNNSACDKTSKCCQPHILSVTPEELQKQRKLLKPAAHRKLKEAVVQVLDMTDILKKALSNRRRVTEPSDELLCRTNTSVTEWSLESSPRLQ